MTIKDRAKALGIKDEEITASEVAELLNITPSTVRVYVNAGRLPVARKRGGANFFRLSDIEEFNKTRGTKPGPKKKI